MPRQPNISAIRAFQSAINRHCDDLHLEDDAEPSVDLFHLLVSAMEWCAYQQPPVDFDQTLAEVREHFMADVP